LQLATLSRWPSPKTIQTCLAFVKGNRYTAFRKEKASPYVGGEEKVMGNRNTRGREKKKPKKKEIKQLNRPARPAPEYKPAAPPPPPSQTDEVMGE
jgi:hypothetical protein